MESNIETFMVFSGDFGLILKSSMNPNYPPNHVINLLISIKSPIYFCRGPIHRLNKGFMGKILTRRVLENQFSTLHFDCVGFGQQDCQETELMPSLISVKYLCKI